MAPPSLGAEREAPLLLGSSCSPHVLAAAGMFSVQNRSGSALLSISAFKGPEGPSSAPHPGPRLFTGRDIPGGAPPAGLFVMFLGRTCRGRRPSELRSASASLAAVFYPLLLNFCTSTHWLVLMSWF